MATVRATMAEDVRERFIPAIDAVENTMREGRRAFARGQRAVEDAADVAALRIRQHPFATVVGAAAIGAVAGALIGLLGGYMVRSKSGACCS